jgi:type II secretory pathway pseudopilin PulG
MRPLLFRSTRSPRGRPGITLLELLIALVIVLTLAALLVYGTGRTSERAHTSVLLNDLSRFRIFAELEQAEHGRPPTDPVAAGRFDFARQVAPLSDVADGGGWEVMLAHA